MTLLDGAHGRQAGRQLEQYFGRDPGEPQRCHRRLCSRSGALPRVHLLETHDGLERHVYRGNNGYSRGIEEATELTRVDAARPGGR